MKTTLTLIAAGLILAGLGRYFANSTPPTPGSAAAVSASGNQLVVEATPAPHDARVNPAPVQRADQAEASPESTDLDDFCSEYHIDLSEEKTARFLAENNQVRKDAQSQLSRSNQSEHLHVAALMENDRNKKLALIERAIESDPQNKLNYRLGVSSCRRAPIPDGCPRPDWEDRLLELDRDNRQSWMVIASSRYARGDIPKAYQALEQAASAEDASSYWTDTLDLAIRGLEAGGMTQFSLRAQAALELAFGATPSYIEYTRMCREQSKTSTTWAHACVTYGRRTAEFSPTFLTESVARAIQIQAHKALGNQQVALELEDLQTSRRVVYFTSVGRQSEKLTHLWMSVPELFYAYLEHVKTHGEIVAGELIAKDVKRYVETYPDLACQALLHEVPNS